ncbi:alpha/beta hydrolase [Hutsoniella sourekii]
MMKRRSIDYYYLKMKTHFIEVPYYDHERRVRVLLPEDYDQEEETYPVLYMHDGQNVFYSKEAYVGHSWKVIKALKQYKDLPKMIVVAIDNSEYRLDEYAPWQTDTHKNTEFSEAGGDGVAYGQWVVETVKPFIDATYRTKSDRANTLLAGSSMGGLITAYMGAAYPEIFGILGVFSSASWFSEQAFQTYIGTHPLNPATKVYIQVGTDEGDDMDAAFIQGSMNQAYIDSSLMYYQNLVANGQPMDKLWLRILANETHHEKYWALHFPTFLHWAFDLPFDIQQLIDSSPVD